jgi:hypothetical protein
VGSSTSGGRQVLRPGRRDPTLPCLKCPLGVRRRVLHVEHRLPDATSEGFGRTRPALGQ